MSKAKTACASIALLLAASTASAAEQKKAEVKSLEATAQKWEFHGCAAIPVTNTAEKPTKEPILTLAKRLTEQAKTR